MSSVPLIYRPAHGVYPGALCVLIHLQSLCPLLHLSALRMLMYLDSTIGLSRVSGKVFVREFLQTYGRDMRWFEGAWDDRA